MKALTVWQPWASLIMAGVKRFETRSWATDYRGPLAIHAAKADLDDLYRFLGHDVHALTELDSATFRGMHRHINELPRGVILGTVELVACVQIPRPPIEGWVASGCGIYGRPLTALELSLGDYTPGRFAWVLADPRPLPEPIPCRGYQRLWTVPEDVAEKVIA